MVRTRHTPVTCGGCLMRGTWLGRYGRVRLFHALLRAVEREEPGTGGAPGSLPVLGEAAQFILGGEKRRWNNVPIEHVDQSLARPAPGGQTGCAPT
jgi:hypothetical protein